ncbi:MAG TPA: hypothetical protein VLW52_13670 [Opitutaceae bacterium]|nr:hypothetical protein [Opitutaceae bacterium]
MSETEIVHDERTVAVENAGFRFAYQLLALGLLFDVMCRARAQRQANWDLMALVVVSGGAATAYQAARKTLAHRWAQFGAVFLIAAALALAIGWLVTRLRS